MNRRLGLWVAAAGSLAAAPLASASFIGAAFVIEATNAQGTGQVVVPIEFGVVGDNGESYTYSLPSALTITSQSGQEIATLLSFNEFMLADPQVSLGFSVQSGVSDTTFTISTALLSFPSLNSPIGTASGSLTVTDTNGDGATLSGIDGAPIYEWDYNGFVPGGTTFASFINSVVAGPNFSNVGNGSLGPSVIPGSVSDMSGRVSFNLSANDLASGTGVFVIQIPTPGAMGFATIAGLVLLPKRRR